MQVEQIFKNSHSYIYELRNHSPQKYLPSAQLIKASVIMHLVIFVAGSIPCEVGENFLLFVIKASAHMRLVIFVAGSIPSEVGENFLLFE